MSNEFSETEIPETADTQPENNSLETGPLSDTGKLSIQGVPPDDDVSIDSDHKPDVPDSLEKEWATVHARNGIEGKPKTEGEPMSIIDTSRPIPDHSFIDEKGRGITLRTWESGDHAYVRGYETEQESVPENVNLGTVGRANATLENQRDGSNRVRLNDIEVEPTYRGAGISEEILDQVEKYGRNHNAGEIYGAIDSDDAQSYWKNQVDNGWHIRQSNSYYGDVYKTLE